MEDYFFLGEGGILFFEKKKFLYEDGIPKVPLSLFGREVAPQRRSEGGERPARTMECNDPLVFSSYKSTIKILNFILFTVLFMNTITMQSIKSRGAKAIPDNVPVYLIVNSKVKSVLVPPEEYDALIKMQEELEDIHAIEERKHEKTVPFEKVFPRKAA